MNLWEEFRCHLLIWPNLDHRSWQIPKKLLSVPPIYLLQFIFGIFNFSGRYFVSEADGRGFNQKQPSLKKIEGFGLKGTNWGWEESLLGKIFEFLHLLFFLGHQRYHHFSTNVSSSFSPQDYLNNPMFDSLNNQRTHRYWPHNSSSDRGTITLRPLTSKKLTTSGALHRKMMGPRSACKVLSW